MLVPLLHPIAMQYGIDPLHFGFLFVFNLVIGMLTPPVGVVLFVMCGISGITLGELSKHVWPFIALMYGLLLRVHVRAAGGADLATHDGVLRWVTTCPPPSRSPRSATSSAPSRRRAIRWSSASRWASCATCRRCRRISRARRCSAAATRRLTRMPPMACSQRPGCWPMPRHRCCCGTAARAPGIGFAHDRALVDAIHAETGITATTSILGLVALLAATGITAAAPS